MFYLLAWSVNQGIYCGCTENRESSWCKSCRHWLHRRLSWRQPTMPPVTTKLTSWQHPVFSGKWYMLAAHSAQWCYDEFYGPLVDHYNDVIMNPMASRITSLTIVYSTVYSGADQRKHQSYASLAFVRGIHRWPVNSPHKGPVTRKMFPFDDVIMIKPIKVAMTLIGVMTDCLTDRLLK